MEPDIFLAHDIEAFYKQNWQKMDFDDGLALCKAFLVIQKVTGIPAIKQKEENEDNILSLLGSGHHLNSTQKDRNPAWIKS